MITYEQRGFPSLMSPRAAGPDLESNEFPTYPSLTVLGSKVLEPRKDLECFPNPNPDHQSLITLHSSEFTCRCPVTGQPDFASILVEYIPNQKIVESKSWKLYLWSFRDERAFHEKVVGEIADFFMEKVEPIEVKVTGIFNPRGGIGITVTVARYQDEGPEFLNYPVDHVQEA